MKISTFVPLVLIVQVQYHLIFAEIYLCTIPYIRNYLTPFQQLDTYAILYSVHILYNTVHVHTVLRKTS